MICREIIKEIEARFPKHYAMEWDNVGLQVGRSDKEVKRIYLALDATDEVIEEAADWGADMLITACPLCMYNLKKNGTGDLPVYYFTELLAEALGVKEEGAK